MGCVIGKRVTGKGEVRRNSNLEEIKEDEQYGAVYRENVEAAKMEPTRVVEFRLRRHEAGDGWPTWLKEALGAAVDDWKPRRANTFEKLDKIGKGTYSNVYKARDLMTGKVVALKKVRFDSSEPETVRFMAREILILRSLDHPNVIKLEGLVISRMLSSLYLVFEYMDHDLTGLASVQTPKFTESQVKCFMKQLLSGLEHCHNNGVLHRDIKCSNLLINNDGDLKIADFGLASFFNPEYKKPMTSRVVTLWYRPPELLLGASCYDVGVDLWSAGCILAELLAGKPILRGRTEVEQLHKIFKLCGSPADDYWKRFRLPNATLYKPQQPYRRCLTETFRDFSPSSLSLMETLLAIDPKERGTATAALYSEFFTTPPYACEPSSLPEFPPSKEMDVKLRDEEGRRLRAIEVKFSRAIPAPEANAELQSNLDRLKMMTDAKAKSVSEDFPPLNQDAGRDVSVSTGASESSSFGFSIFETNQSRSLQQSRPPNVSSRRKTQKENLRRAPSRRFINAFYPSVSWSMDFMFNRRRRPFADIIGDKRS